MRRSLCAALLVVGASALRPALAPLAARPATRARAIVLAEKPRYDDPIFDESLPDPVYDSPSGYLGKAPYGFSTTAEQWNGRAAMAGFTFCFLQEIVFGKGVIELYGLPYDSGAVPQHLWEPSLISGLVAFIAVVGVSGGATYGLLTLNGYFDKK